MNINPAQAKSLLLILLLLVISNAILLFMLINKKTKPEKRSEARENKVKNYLQKEVGFTTAQLASVDTLLKMQNEKMKSYFDSNRTNRSAYFKSIGQSGFNDSVIARLMAENQPKMQQMELNYINNIREIRAIATPAQQQVFDTGFYKMMLRK